MYWLRPCAISFYLPPIKPQSWKTPNLRRMYNEKCDIIFYGRDSGILGIWNILKILVFRVTTGVVSSNGCELKYMYPAYCQDLVSSSDCG